MFRKFRISTVLTLLAGAVTLAACVRSHDSPQRQNEELVVVATSEPAQRPVDAVVETADDINEDPSEPGNARSGESARLPELEAMKKSDGSAPSAPSADSQVGLGGGVGGGGGYGGRVGGAVTRRARGGGSQDRGDGGPTTNTVIRPVQANAALTQGALMAQRGGETIGEFPLKHTKVHAKVSGTTAGTTVTQTFTNPYEQVIEAIYRFPLAGDAAICDFVMESNNRRIRGIVRPREEAKRIYEEARARGQTASLLTQEQPNIFTQRVANIAVKEQVKVTITMYQTLVYRDGRFEYVFPMVVGPRYGSPMPSTTPDAPSPSQPTTRGSTEPAGDSTEGVNAPTLPAGVRSGHDISLSIEIEAGLPLDMSRFRSVNHAIDITMTRTGGAVASLHPEETIPNRDFVLHWGIAGDRPSAGLVTHKDGRGGYFSLQLQPQLDARDADVTPREITFILDISGSMSGAPVQMSREVMLRTLDRLRPDDMFNIIYFSTGNAQLFDLPAPNTPQNIKRAKEFLGTVRGQGGTEMLSALNRALDAEHDPRRIQMYAFLTDGYISETNGIFQAIKDKGTDARFFAFGIGSSVNRMLIDGIGEHGNGKAIYCMPRDGRYADDAADAFFGAIDSPVLCDIEVDWAGLPVADVMPRAQRDLFAAQPMVLHGRFTDAAAGTILVRGRVGARQVTIEASVDFSNADDSNPALAVIWARQKIAALEVERLSAPEDRNVVGEIVELAMAYNLVSQHTSFVAVDESRIVGDGNPVRIFQPVEMPEGVTFEGTDRPAEASRTVGVPGWGLVAGETADGSVIVIAVDDGSAASQAGMRPGQLIRSVGGVPVRGLDSLEGVLQQAQANVKLSIETELRDGDRTHRAQFELPDPAPRQG